MMKTIALLLMLALSASPLAAQTDDHALLEHGRKLLRNDDFAMAKPVLTKLLYDPSTDHDARSRAFALLERSYEALGQNDSLLGLYRSAATLGNHDPLLAANALDQLAGLHLMDGKIESAERAYFDILGLPPQAETDTWDEVGYKKHRACRSLVDLYLTQRRFQEALDIQDLADTDYPLQGVCSFGRHGYAIDRAFTYSHIHEGLGNTNKAIQALLPLAFRDLMFNEDSLVDRTARLFVAKYDAESIHRMVEGALDQLRMIRRGEEAVYTITMFGMDIEIDEDFIAVDSTKRDDLDHCCDLIRNTPFIQKLYRLAGPIEETPRLTYGQFTDSFGTFWYLPAIVAVIIMTLRAARNRQEITTTGNDRE